jgi:hypothetical protein
VVVAICCPSSDSCLPSQVGGHQEGEAELSVLGPTFLQEGGWGVQGLPGSRRLLMDRSAGVEGQL